MPKLLDDEQIYRSVIQTISQSGYNGATTKKMADAAGISEVSLFRKYRSKQQLVKAALSFIIDETDLKNASQYTGDIHTDLTRMIKAYYTLANKYGSFASVLLFEIAHHSNLVDLITESLDIFLRFSKLITRYQNEGVLLKEHPLIALASLLSPIIFTFNLKRITQTHNLYLELDDVDVGDLVTTFLSGRLHRSDEE